MPRRLLKVVAKRLILTIKHFSELHVSWCLISFDKIFVLIN
jgi:hypothetical protein